MASVHSKTRSSRAPSGNSRVRSSSSRRTSTPRDPSKAQYQRGLKGLPFEAPFDPDSEAIAREAYDAGAADRKKQHRSTDKKARKTQTRTRVRARARTAKGYYRRGAKQLRNPVRQQLTSGSQVFVLSLALVGLYLVLQTSDKVEGFIGGVTSAVKWLADPTASIPHKPS